MAGPLYAGPKEHAAIYTDILESRPHHVKQFADLGILECRWTANVVERTDGKNEETTVQTKADLNPDEHNQ
eukprot:5021976-Pyramimonas_sp.AAC.1